MAASGPGNPVPPRFYSPSKDKRNTMKIRCPCDEFISSTGATWAKTFEVKEPIRHRKGYTLYKVVSKLYPVAAPEAVTQVQVGKQKLFRLSLLAETLTF
jgi:hypothetical protein